jgi:hypothetical protein
MPSRTCPFKNKSHPIRRDRFLVGDLKPLPAQKIHDGISDKLRPRFPRAPGINFFGKPAIRPKTHERLAVPSHIRHDECLTPDKNNTKKFLTGC